MVRLTIALAFSLLLLTRTSTFAQEKSGLELMILANSVDDKDAIENARKYFHDEANKADIEKCQKDGVPPAAPREKYSLVLFRGARSVVRYRWVELGPHELRALNLDNSAESDAKRDATWKAAKLNRDKAATLPETFGDPQYRRQLLQGALFYSRECRNLNLKEKERSEKKVEYFVLARRPEIDAADPKGERETAAVGGNLIDSVTIGKEADRPALNVQFNKEGTRLFAILTAKNVSLRNPDDSTSIRRHLAIVVDGQVISAPTLISAIPGGRAMITGNFSQKDIEQLAEKIRPKK
jgi:hypothetical protein